MKILLSSARWLAVAAAIMASVVSWADGQPDTTFGANGVVKIAFPTSSLGYLYGTALLNGQIEAVGFEEPNSGISPTNPPPKLFIAQLSLSGLVSSMQTIAQTAITNPQGLVIGANGDVFVVGLNYDSNQYLNAVAVRFSSTGTLIASYTRPATSITDQSACPDFRPVLDSQGRLVASCTYGNYTASVQLAALRLLPQNTSLVPDPAFGTNGFSKISTLPTGYTSAVGTAIIQDGTSGAYYVGGFACNGSSCLGPNAANPRANFVARLNATDGSLDTNYGNSPAGFGIALVPSNSRAGNPEGITLDSAGRVVIGGNYDVVGASSGTGYVARLNSIGQPDKTFGTNGVFQSFSEIIDVLTDASNRVYALDHGSQLYRLTEVGALDATFGSGSNVQTVNGPASAWQSMQFADSSNSSVYLLGGVSPCTSGCPNSATTAVIEKLIVAASAGQVAVPNVVGQTQAAATTTITAAGLMLGTLTQQSSSTVASGSVISENPAAGTNVASGSAVNLVVSTGAPAQVTVPNVVGQTQTAATTAITGAGLMLGTVTQQSSSTVASGSVISESPAAATMVAGGSAVNLVVSTGPAPVAVPNVVGQTQAAATTAITAVGLALGTVTMQSSSTVASGSVISESPAAGTMVASASAVNLTVSNGAPMGGGGGGGGGGGSISLVDLGALFLLVWARITGLSRSRNLPRMRGSRV